MSINDYKHYLFVVEQNTTTQYSSHPSGFQQGDGITKLYLQQMLGITDIVTRSDAV